jgi:hypothetical protein
MDGSENAKPLELCKFKFPWCLKNVKSLPMCYEANIQAWKGPGGSMSWVAGLPNNSYKPTTNTAWVCARLLKWQTRGSGEPVSLTWHK